MKQKSHHSRKAKYFAPRVSPKAIRQLILGYLEELDTPRALTVALIVREGIAGGVEDEIANLVINPLNYNDPEQFALDYQATELLRKWEALQVSWDPRKKAIEKFWAAEAQCSSSNAKLRRRLDEDGKLTQILARAEFALKALLGDVNADLLNSIPAYGGWGKGVTSSCKGSWRTEFHKLEAQPQATRLLQPLARAAMRDATGGIYDREIEEVVGSVVGFVPKDARAHRSIAVEPSVNQFLQRGIGLAIRRRLKRRWRLDLSSQTRNQDLAREGARDGSFATIDLSAASDTVSLEIVERLLPPDWVALLRSTRCAFTQVDGKTHMLHKWSSMGNGYTFELETAIFAALVRAVLPSDVWYAGDWAVYGDDIIVPTQFASDLCEVLAYCGFSLNERKTFVSGPFRESCGADFFMERPVRPFYLKKVGWLPLVEMANWIFERSLSRHFGTWKRIHEMLGPGFPRITTVDEGIGLLVDELTFRQTYPASDYVLRRGLRVRKVYVMEWQPKTMKSSRIDGPNAVIAHLRLLLARGPTILSEPWRLTASETGEWVRIARYVE